MWELLTRQQPYETLSPAAVAVAVIRDQLRPTVPEDAPADFTTLITNCWHYDSGIRPTFLEIMTRLSAIVGDQSVSHTSHTSSNNSSSASGNIFRLPNGKWATHSRSMRGLDASIGGRSSTASSDMDEIARLTRTIDRAPVPDGRVAIVFTDVTRAATLWEFNAQAMRDATLLHNQVLRDLLKRWSGYEAMLLRERNSGEGSFCMVFTNAVNAVGWCSEAQQELIKVEWPEALLEHPGAAEEWGDTDDRLIFRGLRVRMGIHFGEPRRVRDPMTRRIEYYGPVVNAAARITALTHGGQARTTFIQLYIMYRRLTLVMAGGGAGRAVAIGPRRA